MKYNRKHTRKLAVFLSLLMIFSAMGATISSFGAEAAADRTSAEEPDHKVDTPDDRSDAGEDKNPDVSYVVNNDNFESIAEKIKLQEDEEITLILSGDIDQPFAGIEKKHITLKSQGAQTHEINIAGELVGDLTIDNVFAKAADLYCNGHRTIFTENAQFAIKGTLYGGGNEKNVDSTYVVVNGTGSINTMDRENVVVGGSYKASVEGDIYLELAGNIVYNKNNGGHYLTATNRETSYGGDTYTGEPLYVGGNVTLIFDNDNADAKPVNIVGTHNSHVKGNLEVIVKAGYTTGIEAQRENPERAVVDGNIHIQAGAEEYENTGRVCRIGGNWDIVGAGEKINLTKKSYQAGGNVTIDTYENVWGWEKDGETPDDPPGIVGAMSAHVKGDLTINVRGSHMEDVIGTDTVSASSNVEGNITINAENVNLANASNYQSGIIPLMEGTAEGDVSVHLDGGSLSGIYGYGGTITGKLSVNITGSPFFTDDEAGVWGTNSTESENKSVVTFDGAETQVPIIGYFTKTNIINGSKVTLGNDKKNAFASGSIYDVEVSGSAALVTNQQAYAKGSLTMEQGSLTANGFVYITGAANTQNSKLIFNDYTAIGYGFKDSSQREQVVTSKNDEVIFNKHSYINPIYGHVDIEGGSWTVLQPLSIKGNYTGKDNLYLLPAFSESQNYPEETIPVEILGEAKGTTDVKLVAAESPKDEGTPIVGHNYINGLKISEDVFRLINENAKPEGLYFKKTADADAENKPAYDMWQVAKKENITPPAENGNLIITKTVSGSEGEKDRDFHFSVQLSDKTINGIYGDLEFTDGKAIFSLKHGEQKIAEGLPCDISYRVTEKEANQDGYTTSADHAEGILTGAGVTVSFTNTKEGSSIVPGEPNKPEKPEQPDKPDQPDEEKPEQPDKPDQPDEEKPEQPDKPDQPDEEKPDKPEKPGQPNEEKPQRTDKSDSSDKGIPKTGDQANLALWLSIMGVGGAGLIFATAAGRRRQKKDRI